MTSDEAEAEAKAAFALLRPVCVEVMRAPSVQTLAALDARLAGIRSIHPHLVDYVALPLRTIIKRSGSSDIRLLEATVATLSLVFSRVRGLESWDLFQEVLVFSCMLLDDKLSQESGYTNVSEDLTRVVVVMLRSLLLSLADSIRLKLHSNLPMVGHCVVVLLNTLDSYKSKDVRMAACGSLLALTAVDSEVVMDRERAGSNIDAATCPDHTHTLRAVLDAVGPGAGRGGAVGSVFASFLPGIATGLTDLVTFGANVGQFVTSLVVVTWTHYVSLVMADGNWEEEEEVEDLSVLMSSSTQPPAEPASGESSHSHPSPPTGSLEVERTRRWRAETDRHLSFFVQRLSSLVTHEGWRVRLTMVHWAHCLLTYCHRTLTACMPKVLEVLVTLSHDDYSQVSGPAHQTLEIFSQRYSREGSRQLMSVLEERLHALASALPRLMRQHDDTRKLSTLQLVVGYLKILGSSVVTLVNSHAHLSRLMLAIVQTLQMDTGNIRVVEQPSTSLVAGSDFYSFPLRYQHFRLERIETLLHQICQLLGYYGSPPVLIDHLMDLFRGSTQHRKEVTMVISHVLLGAAGQGCRGSEADEPTQHHASQEQLFFLVEGVLEEIVVPEAWNSSSSSSPQESTLLSCLLLKAVATFAQVLDADFERLMLRAAYPLLQKLGHSNASVSSHALYALRAVSSHCGYSSIQDLITRNADYLVNGVALRLRGGASRHPEALQVLQAVLTHGNEGVIPLMRDSIDELLLSLDLGEDPTLIWPTLLTLTMATSKWAGPIPEKNESRSVPAEGGREREWEEEGGRAREGEEDLKEHVQVSAEEVQAFFLNYHRRKEQELLTGEEEEGEGEGGDGREEEESYSQTKRLPPVHQATVDVLQRCTHHLAVPSPSLRLTVLDSLGHCLKALGADEHTLLPEVHKVWPAFLPRLSDSSPVVALRAWEVLNMMGVACGDFLRQRVVREVWPHLISSLEKLTKRSRHADKFYRQTADFKLQRKLLGDLGSFCSEMDISPVDSELLFHACFPYLSSDQPPELQLACKTGLTGVIRRDPDRMWLLLQQLLPQSTEGGGVTTPPHPVLNPYKFPVFPSAEKYVKNVQSLLQLTV